MSLKNLCGAKVAKKLVYLHFFRLKFLVIRLKIKVGFNENEDANDNFYLFMQESFFLSIGCNFK